MYIITLKNISEGFDIVIFLGFVVGIFNYVFFLFNRKFQNMLFDQNKIFKASMKVFGFTLNLIMFKRLYVNSTKK